MSWARIMAPLSGGQGDAAAVAAAVMLAEPFQAEMVGVYTPADVADVMPWMGEGFLGGVQTTALESLKEAAQVGEKNARAAMDKTSYAKSRFISLQTPVWAGLSAESRLCDVVVFTSDPARGRGPLAEAFQQMVADEQRPVLIARTALPLLQKASKVVILAAPKASSRSFDAGRLQSYYAARGVEAEVDVLPDTGDAAPVLLYAARKSGADILVAGAFGHPRLQEFIFGGTTRTLLNSDAPSLFLSH